MSTVKLDDEQTHEDLSGIIAKLMSNGFNNLQVQGKFIRPSYERPHMSEVSYSQNIPVVDLNDLDGPNRTRVVQEIQRACEGYGSFQVHLSIPIPYHINTFTRINLYAN